MACMAYNSKQQLNLKVCFDCSSSLMYGHCEVDSGATEAFYLFIDDN